MVALGLLATLAIACGTSDIANDAEVTVTGALLNSDGSPAAGVRIVLTEQPTGLDALAELTVTVSSIGILCLAREVSFCKGARRATTDAEGRYSFTMKGKDAKTILGNPAHFALSAEHVSGPRIHARFALSEEAFEVLTIKFWNPEPLQVSAGQQWVDYSWPAFDNKPASDGYLAELTQGEELVWSQESRRPTGRIDARAIADMQGEFRAVAVVKHHGFTVHHYSPPVPVDGKAGAPPSRNANCSVAGGDGPAPVSPCPFTDGGYANRFPSQSCAPASPAPQTPCAANTSLVVDLAGARSISALFLHGLHSTANLDLLTSTDGLTWTRQSTLKPSPYTAFTLPSPVTARYLRLDATNGTLHSLHELSAWP